MKIVHIEARRKETFLLPDEFVKKLPKSVVLFTVIQYQNSFNAIKKQLEENNIKVDAVKPRHTRYEGQLLGCSTTKFDTDAEAFVYVGDGLFHPKALVMKNNKPVYAYDPQTEQSGEVHNSDVEIIRKKLKGSYLKFLTSENIGVLITLKPGQYKEYMTKGLRERYPNKNFYFFVDSSFNFQSLADFPFIDIFLNTMCERIGYDDMDVQGVKIMNLEDLFELEIQ